MYDRQILGILSDVGQRGISVQALAKHVYNMNCTLFASPQYDDVKSYVQKYLLKNSKSSQSLIERTERRGYYRLNTKGNADARQLVLDFRSGNAVEKETEADVQSSLVRDLSLDLFDGLL